MQSWLSVGSVAMACVLWCSCASDRTVTYQKAEAEGVDKYGTQMSYEASEDGAVRPKGGRSKRSQFESQSSYTGYRQQSGSQFSRGAYQSKPYSGSKAYHTQSYAGGQDGSKFRNTPHFAQQQSLEQGEYSNVNGQGYGTTQFYGSNRTVAQGSNVSKVENANVNHKNNHYVQPQVIGQKDAAALNVEQTNAMLGR